MTPPPGTKLPFCVGVYQDQLLYAPDIQAGRAAVLVLGGLLRSPDLAAVTKSLAMHAEAFAALDTDLLVLGSFSAGPAAWLSAPANAADPPVVLCNDSFFAECGLAPGIDAIVVIDRSWRVLDSWLTSEHNPTDLADAVLRAASAIPREAPRDCRLPAPLLAIPKLFDAGLCANLTNHFEIGTKFDSGLTAAANDGIARERLDHKKKRRTDCLLTPADSAHAQVLEALYTRCAPEIKRAFQCDVAFNDRILIARYDESGGYFKRHRDNMNEAVTFRQFALSINLNTGAYQGGQIIFPEFNDHRYAPEAGGGIVFSTSLLHEALPVTRGQRYVLLTFLHDSAAEQRRLAYKQTQVRRILYEVKAKQEAVLF
jgi:predicted 2-oxoglutarate/Fe(II)-dependent dioxygenase YbiX